MAHPSDYLQRLRAEEPFVRALARALVQGDADDVVQQAWLRVLERRPHDGEAGPGDAGPGDAGPADPRAWLARVVRNLVADRRRRDQRRRAREREAAAPERVPSSAELLLGEERRRALVHAVDALPAPLRTVVLMRWYDGLPPRRIATALGLPVTTVWNRLHAALQELRQRLDDDHGGDRRAWLVPLVPFACAPRSLPWREVLTGAGNGLGLGGLVMTAKTKTMAAAAVLVVAAVAWMVWPAAADLPAVPPAGSGGQAVAAATGEVPPSGDAATPSEPAQRAPVADDPTAAPTTGTLVVHVRYPDEPHEAAGLEVSLGEPDGDFRVGLRRAVTDDTGSVRFDALEEREWIVATRREGGRKRVAVRAGETTECTMDLAVGLDIAGIVVDPAGIGIPGAVVEVAAAATAGMDAGPAVITAADGTFALRSAYSHCLVGARAHGFAASQLHYLGSEQGRNGPLRIELSRPGGSVTGAVMDASGAAVANAVVRVGDGQTDSIRSSDQGAAPLPAQVCTDAEGRFAAVGVPVGSQLLQVRAARLAPYSGTCEVVAGATIATHVVLVAGVTVHGVVRDEDLAPAPGASVGYGQRGEFVQFRTATAADGTFALAGLPPEPFELTASLRGKGKASARLAGTPGATMQCDLQLSNGIALRGRVTGEDGEPIRSVELVCIADAAPHWTETTITDGQGRFLVPRCPEGRTLAVRFTKQGHTTVERTAVDPRAGELDIRMAPDRAPVRITGVVMAPDGGQNLAVTVDAFEQPPKRGRVWAHPSTGEPFTLEVAAGDWEVRIGCSDHPTVFAGKRELLAGASWDLGTIQLARGGRVVVHVPQRSGLAYLVMTAGGGFRCGLSTPTPPLRSELLAPGDYRLLVRGEGIAARAVPFSIRPDAETELELQPQPGVRQRVEFVPAGPGLEAPQSVGFELYRDGGLVMVNFAGRKDTAPPSCDIWLAPGGYTLRMRGRDPRAEVAFTIGESEGPPLRVALR